jgi:hypothetical protein
MYRMQAPISLIPNRGVISARVFDNPSIGLKPTLFFDIHIPIVPFAWNGETATTSARLDFIDFKIREWDDLPEKAFPFPVNPSRGYIDGSIYLDHTHYPMDVTRISFQKRGIDSIVGAFTWSVDVTSGHRELGVVRGTWEIPLEFDGERILQVFADARNVGALLGQKPWWKIW